MSNPAEREALMDEFPMEYAVFDTEFVQKASDLMVPKEMLYYSAVVDNEDHIVSLQDQDFTGVETDFHTLYKYVVGN